MKLLRETIRNLLLESAVNPKIAAAVAQLKKQKAKLKVILKGPKLEIKIMKGRKMIGNLKANIRKRGCYNGWIVEWAGIDEKWREFGWGALMYDVFIELAGKTGVAADRDSVSEDAITFWSWFHKNPNLYTRKPFDNSDFNFTKTPVDDCNGWGWESYPAADGEIYYTDDLESMSRRKAKKIYQNHMLNNLYIKKDMTQPTINYLKSFGKRSRLITGV